MNSMFGSIKKWGWWLGLFLFHELVMGLSPVIPFLRPSVTTLQRTERYYPHAVLWIQYDALLYLHIAHHGYGSAISAFYPLLPILIAVLHSTWIAFLVMQGVFAVDLWLLALWLGDTLGLKDRQVIMALALFAFNPAAVFYTTLYPEALLVLFWLLSLRAASRKSYGAAAVFAGFGALAYPTGALFGIIPLWLFAASVIHKQFDHAREYFLWGLGIAVSLGLFMLFSLFQWHTPWGPWMGEAAWHSRWIWPWQQYTRIFPIHNTVKRTYLFVLALLSVPFLVGALSLVRLSFPMKWPIILFTGAALIVSLAFYANNTPFHSTLRIMSIAFPVYGGLGAIRRRRLFQLILILWMGSSFVGAVFFTHQLWWQ